MTVPDFTSKGPPNCATVDPDIFFPEEDLPGYEDTVELAKSICRTCPYLDSCRSYALSADEQGIWGGMTKKERSLFRRRAIRAKRVAAKSGRTSVGMPTRIGT